MNPNAIPQPQPDVIASFGSLSASKHFGLADASPADAIAKVTHPQDLDKLVNAYQRATSEGVAIETEVRVRCNDGQYRWFLHQLQPMQDGGSAKDHKRAQECVQRENIALREEVDKISMFEEIVGSSQPLLAVLERIAKVARTDSTVLITGETGTGKELVARAIHKRSQRAGKAFVSVNCAAIPRDLIASELFGHEKGAFTGALQRRLGRFEMAEGGTIFLDEIGELPAETQVALLRVLQEKEFQRVGSNQTIRTNVRVIVATHRDLPAAIEAGTFRSDLFYRINVFPIEMPALRERKEDISLLVKYFIDRYSSKTGKKIATIDRKSMERLQNYPWPGNIRELQNVIERSIIVCDTEEFSVDDSWLSEEASFSRPMANEIASQEKDMIEAALAHAKGRVSGDSGAAAILRMPASTLDYKIKSLKIDKRQFQTV